MFYRHPLFRLLAITLFVLGAALAALTGMQWIGSQQRYVTTNIRWLLKPLWGVARMAPDQCNENGLRKLATLGKDWMIWVDVQSNPITGWGAVCPQKPFEMGPAAFGPSLRQIFLMLSQRPVIFNVRAQDARTAEDFLQAMESNARGKLDIGIASPSQSLLRTLRRQHPEWLFAADSSTWTKLKIYSSLGIAAAVDLWPDFFVASTNPSSPDFFSLTAANEILRRKKVILLDWDGTTPIPEAWRASLRGFLTNRPKNIPADTFFREMGAK